MMITKDHKIGVAGSGTMGRGIAQAAAASGHPVVLFDNNETALEQAKGLISDALKQQVEKNKISIEDADAVLNRIHFASKPEVLAGSSLVIEAVFEDAGVKQKLFTSLEKLVSPGCILASNTSSLSITSLASMCSRPEHFIGLHFFNPAHLMPLVEIVPASGTEKKVLEDCFALMQSWKKIPVVARDTPGFIVNRIARPFYGEAIRIFEEGIADFPVIDQVMKQRGGFRMGPFELMDFIGIDVNYSVTETVWRQTFFDPRYKPSITQQRLFQSGHYGRKTGKGFYDYSKGKPENVLLPDEALSENIFMRIISMLINEAYEALYYGIATKEDIETAMTRGVNYPKGLFQWAGEIGIKKIYQVMKSLHEDYTEERYRPSLLLSRDALKS